MQRTLGRIQNAKMKTMHQKRQSDALHGSLEQRCKLNFPILRAIKSFHIRLVAIIRAKTTNFAQQQNRPFLTSQIFVSLSIHELLMWQSRCWHIGHIRLVFFCVYIQISLEAFCSEKYNAYVTCLPGEYFISRYCRRQDFPMKKSRWKNKLLTETTMTDYWINFIILPYLNC